jgi:hypothetical protein
MLKLENLSPRLEVVLKGVNIIVDLEASRYWYNVVNSLR